LFPWDLRKYIYIPEVIGAISPSKEDLIGSGSTLFKVRKHRRARRLTEVTLYYNGFRLDRRRRATMTQHSLQSSPSSSTDAGRSVTVTIRPSVLRFGLVTRLAGAGILVAGIWAVIGWVLR
jgi:hypothetical protein